MKTDLSNLGILKGSFVIVLLALLLAPPVSAESAGGWKQAFNTTELNIFSLAVYDGRLFAGTHPNSKVFEFDGTDWKPSVNFKNGTQVAVLYSDPGGYLYAGLHDSNGVDAGEIWRYNGTDWEFEFRTNSSIHTIHSLTNYSGHLFAGTGPGGLIFVKNGTWEPEFNTTADGTVYALNEYNDTLYASTGAPGMIFKFDRVGWDLDYSSSETSFSTRFEGYDGELYTGSYPLARMYKYNGTDWYSPFNLSNVSGSAKAIRTLRNFSGQLFFTVHPNSEEFVLVYRYNGTDIILDANLSSEGAGQELEVFDYDVYDHKLYLGTGPNGRIYVLEPYTISGTVRDEEGTPLEGVSVSDGSGIGSATTDAAGFYNLTHRYANGTYILTFSKPGYDPSWVSVEVRGDGITVDANLSVSDFMSPTTTNDAPETWQATPFNVTLLCDDGNGSGCAFTTYRLDGGNWTNGTSVPITADGNHTIEYYSVDGIGNTETTKTDHAALDMTPPILTVTSPVNRTYPTTYFDLNFTAEDPLAGVDWTGYSLDGGPNVPSGNVTLYGNDNGPHTITVYANDSAGNLATSTITFTIDVLDLILALWTDQSSYGAGDKVTMYANITNRDNVSHNELEVTFLIRDPDEIIVHNATIQVQNLNPGDTKRISDRFFLSSSATPGTYTMEARLFAAAAPYDIQWYTFEVT
jgi:hypothetical protein